MADITARLPYPLSERVASTSSRITAQAGRAIDYAIGGIPFLSAASKDNPLVIQTADMRRDQFDAEQEPGEQSLQGWWLRSQDSWHHGGGAKFQEPRSSDKPSSRFYDSTGVDPWTEGELKLLRRTAQATSAASEARCVYVADGSLYLGVGADVRRTTIGSSSATTQLANLPGELVEDIVVGRDSWYAITNLGKVYTRPVAGGTLKLLNLSSADPAPSVAPRLLWAKHRLWATWGRHVYVVDTAAASGSFVTPLYSFPTLDWVYTDICDGPACVYLSGWSDAESSLQKVVLQDDGTIPTITAGVTTAVMPRGERVQRIGVLAGTWIGMGTSKGFRVGAVDTNGDVQYGPLFLTPEGVTEAKAVTAYDRWFYCAWDTSDDRGCVYRVDASVQPEDDGAFAWARDAETTTPGHFTDLAVTDGRVVGAFDSAGAVKYLYQHATELVLEGSITFGKIRYRTTEPKLFKYVAVDVEPLAGSIALDAVLTNESTARFALLNEQGKSEFEQATLPASLGPQRSMGLTLTLTRSTTNAAAGPVLHSYSVKAVPAVKPQRLIQLPVSCFDFEQWTTGQEDGKDGWGHDRLDSLQAIEDSGDLVLWQDFSEGEGSSGRLVKIDKVQFVQQAPPNPVQKGRGWGGYVTLILRTMD